MKINNLIAGCMLIAAGLGLAGCSDDASTAENENNVANIKTTSVSVDFETAVSAVAQMRVGWNLGNTLESNSNENPGWIERYTDHSVKAYETAWGQPQADEHLIQAMKTEGFNAIRVPVTWWPHLDKDTLIDAQWMARVREVVDYVVRNNMYCILNIHHDTGAGSSNWLKADVDNFDGINKKFVKIWKQIAEEFKDYDEHLLFEGYNEMLDAGNNWNAPADRRDLQAVNKFAQNFVNTVRATGGNNAKRNLVVSTYAAAYGGNWGNTPYVLSDFVIPTDPTGNQKHIAVEVHSYAPWQWMKNNGGRWTSSCDEEIRNMYATLKSRFIDNGYPVIVGEYGPSTEGMEDGAGNNEAKYDMPQMATSYVKYAKQYGVACFYWMGLVDGADRSEATFKWTMPKTTDAIITAWYGEGNQPGTTTSIKKIYR